MRADPSFTPIETERLLLRRSLPKDAEAISAYRSDPEVHRYQGWAHTDPEGVRRDLLEMVPRMPGQPDGWVQFTVLSGETGEIVGDVGLSPADDDPGVIKVGYTISPRFQSLGYASEAVGALVEYSFQTLETEVVRAYASAENVASIRVAEKVGMILMERFEELEDGQLWHGVRYEIRAPS